MAGSSEGLLQEQRLLGEDPTLDAAGLETLLTGSDIELGSFAIMVNSSSSMKALADSDYAMSSITGSDQAMAIVADSENAMRVIAAKDNATEKIVNTTKAACALVKSRTALQAYKADPEYDQRLKDFTNTSASRLKRDIFTTSGNLTVIASGTDSLAALGIYCLAGGGTGGTAGGAGGGSGGESQFLLKTTSLPTTDLTVTVGGAATLSEVVGQVTSTAGNNGVSAPNGAGGAAAGTTSDGAANNIIDTEVLTAVWPCSDTLSVAGGAGGNGSTGTTADDGLKGFSGEGGLGNTIQNLAGAGTGLGSGGGGGANGLAGISGVADANSGCGGGGGSTANPTGGAGGSGLIVIYSVVNE